jgi:site-specific DNA recombinase
VESNQGHKLIWRQSKPKTPQLKPYLYRGFFRCGECGCFITTETQKGHNYLRCTKRVIPCTQKYVREDQIAPQVDQEIGRVALEALLADTMIAELQSEREATAKSQEAAIARCKAELATCEKQTDLLLDMRLNEQISEPEYVSKKHALVNHKAELKGKLEAFERNRLNRFEPLMQFVSEAKNATFLLAEGNKEKNRDFLKKIGSNFDVAEKTLTVEFKKPWIYLAEFNSEPATIIARERGNPLESNWRREGDSNPRWVLAHSRFPGVCVKPLCHLSTPDRIVCAGRKYKP